MSASEHLATLACTTSQVKLRAAADAMVLAPWEYLYQPGLSTSSCLSQVSRSHQTGHTLHRKGRPSRFLSVEANLQEFWQHGWANASPGAWVPFPGCLATPESKADQPQQTTKTGS